MSKNIITFTIYGEPIAKGRPRSFSIKKNGKFVGVRNVTPERTRRYESIVRDEGQKVMLENNLAVLTGLVKLHIKGFWQWPKSKFRKTKPREEELYPSRVDADNLLKSVSDAFNSLFYLDDKQVVIATSEKWRAKQGDPARVEVTIESLDKEWSKEAA